MSYPTHRTHRHDDEPRRQPRPAARRVRTRQAAIRLAIQEG